MTRGFQKVQILDQPTSAYPIELDNSYVKLRIEQAQFFYETEEILGALVQPSSVALVSSVEVTDIPGSLPVKYFNVYNFTGVKRNQPSQLGLSIDLTDWIPAWNTAKISFEFRFVVLRNNPFQKLYQEMSTRQLASKAGLFSKEVGAAIGVSQITAQILGYLLQEGKAEEPLDAVRYTANLSELPTGYSAFLGSIKSKNLPSQLHLNHSERIDTSMHTQIDQCSYFLLKAISLNRMGDILAKSTNWWELLENSKQLVLLDADKDLMPEQKNRWFLNMAQLAKKWADQDKRLLKTEVDDILRLFYGEVEKRLFPEHPHSPETYHPSMKSLLGVQNKDELEAAIQDYKIGLELAQKLQKEYGE